MQCFYVPGSTSIIDTINPATNRSAICNETVEQVQERHPGAEIWDFEKACTQIKAIIYATSITGPVEITQERWYEMLNVLPPMNWRSGDSVESFMVCEAVTIDLHSIFCRIGDRYFSMTDRRSLTHKEIVAACLPLLNPEIEEPETEFVYTCPSCGSVPIPFETECSECGHSLAP